MNAEILKRAGIDYDRGVKRFVGRAHLYEKALSKFPKDSTFSRIRAAYAAGDKEQLFASVHECKGMCGNIALTSLYETADTMVQMLRGGAYSETELAAAYEKLEREYHVVYDAVLAAMEETL